MSRWEATSASRGGGSTVSSWKHETDEEVMVVDGWLAVGV